MRQPGSSSDSIPPEEREGLEFKTRFDAIMEKGRFKDIPPGSVFPSDLEGVRAINIFAPPVENPQSAYVVVYYEENGKGRQEVMTLLGSGVLSGRLPRALEGRVRREDIQREVLGDLEALKLDFWVTTDKDILPPGEWPDAESMSAGKGERRPGTPTVDRERLAFLREQPQALFGFVNSRDGGFEGYRGFVFPNFVVLEHPVTKNAAYFLDVPRIEKTRLTREEKLQFLDGPWADELQMTKQQHIERGTKRVVHAGEDWKEVMAAEIQKRLEQQ